MAALFSALAHALEGNVWLAAAAAAAWGVLSILLSPCHLSSIPLIVGFIHGRGKLGARGAFSIALLFSAGILLTIVGLGATTAVLGRIAGDVGPAGNYLVAAVFFLVGLSFLDIVRMPGLRLGTGNLKCGGGITAFILGLVFGIAIGPCTFAYMAPVLAIAFRLGARHLGAATFLLAMYGVGHCSVIVAAGASTQWVQKFLDWNEESRGPTVVRRACGVLVCLGGLYLIYTAR